MLYNYDTANKPRYNALESANDQGTEERHDIPACDRHKHCEYDVFVPMTVRPYVQVLKPDAKCDGDMQVEPGLKCCDDDRGEFCYTLQQELSVDVPLKYGVIVHYHKPCIEEKEEEEC